jgi:transposase
VRTSLSDQQWDLVKDLFDPMVRPGAPAQIGRRLMVEAMRHQLQGGGRWRDLPERYGSWGAVWQQFRRWRDKGIWDQAMDRLVPAVRVAQKRDPRPSLLMIDAQTVKGGRFGPTFHQAGGPGGRVCGTKRTVLIDYLGLPVACRADSAKPADVTAGRLLLKERLNDFPRVSTVMGDRGYRKLLVLVKRKGIKLEIKFPPPGQGFVPIAPLYKVEQTWANIGRNRRLARCFEGTAASAHAWLAMACLDYLMSRL